MLNDIPESFFLERFDSKVFVVRVLFCFICVSLQAKKLVTDVNVIVITLNLVIL
jgi:hypothetical protein